MRCLTKQAYSRQLFLSSRPRRQPESVQLQFDFFSWAVDYRRAATMVDYFGSSRDIQEWTMTVATRTTKATGQNQLSAVSVTTVQFVPCSVRNMPDGFSRQSAIVTGTAAMRPASSAAIDPTSHDRARIDSLQIGNPQQAVTGQRTSL